MLFKDIIDGRFRVFSRMKDEEKADNIGVVKYVENLASMAGVNISQWDCMKVFGKADTGNKLVKDKNEINRLFFNEIEAIAAASPTKDASGTAIISDEVRQMLKAAESRHIVGLMAREQRDADSNMKTAVDYYKNYEQYLKKAGEHMQTIRRLSGKDAGLEPQIQKIHDSAFWEFVGIEGGSKISFVTRADIILTHKNEAAGVDIRLNFGRFKATFNVNGFQLLVHTFEKNLSSHGYHHPHISGGGICWGSASATATRMLADCQIVEPMTLLATVLSNYNAASPYQSLERFQETVGTPEELEREDRQEELRQATIAAFAAADASVLDVLLRREETAPPEAADLANATPVADEANIFDDIAAVVATQRVVTAYQMRTDANHVTITTTTTSGG